VAANPPTILREILARKAGEIVERLAQRSLTELDALAAAQPWPGGPQPAMRR
jgi:hypothetical protein